MVRQIRLLPVLMGCAAVLFVMKTAGIVEGTMALSSTPANAQQQSTRTSAPKGAAKPATAEQQRPASLAARTADIATMSESELSIYRDLSRRRQELDKRDADLATREQYILVTEKRVDQKLAELKALETKLKNLVAAGEKKQNERLASIVKMYENMKPKDAAQIFQKLDMPVQMEVATRMKETKMAPILAAMTPDAAKILTTEMASRAKLPSPGV